MKTRIQNLFVVLVCTGFMAMPAMAQTFSLLHTLNISDGESPDGLVLSGNILYGTGLNGGTNGNGTVFKVNIDGTGFTNLHTFAVVSSGIINGNSYNTNRDGENPGRLLLSGNTLYGAATKGGTNGSGTVFKVNTDGTGFTNLYNFSILTHSTNSDGASPDGGELTISGNTLYGTALLGGANHNGTVFKINTDGTGFTNLYTFSAGTGSGLDIGNNDGARPNGTLTLSGNTLYGTTTTGGTGASGVLFKVNTDGSGFTNFYSFTGGYDGSLPVGLLFLSGNTLYGATLNGGTNGTGTLFTINTDGTEFMNLYAFSAGKGTAPYITNSDGANPSLEILTNNTLYGRAGFGTSSGDGSVFQINIDGTGFTNLYNFTALSVPFTGTNRDGADPGGFILSGSTLYGVAEEGGTNGYGTVFSLSLPLAVNTTSLPNGTNGIAYSQTLSAGGQPPYTWTTSVGALPPGLTLATNGIISGTPTTNGTFNFTVKVTDAANDMATQALVLTVGYPPSVVMQPTNNSIAVMAGNNMTFVALVGGTGPFSYQWQLNGTNLLNGIITTVAGNGYGAGTYNGGYSGDGGAATNAELNGPVATALDVSGNLFIADFQNNVIRKVGANGIITTVAGNGYRAGTGTGGYSGDGGVATNAELYFPQGVAVDAIGNLFIADTYNNVIRKVGTNGIITTVAGNGYGAGLGYGGYSGDGGVATNAELYFPGVAVDAIGNLFVADSQNNVIREVGTNGIITTMAGNGYGAGTGTGGYSGDGGVATNAELNQPGSVAVDATGNLFIADFQNNVIRKVGTNGIITTVAGNGYGAGLSYGDGGYSGDGGSATNAELNGPVATALDAIGNLFIADSQNNVIREVGTNGIITTVAGNGYGAGTGTGGYSGDGGVATSAELYVPQGVAVDASGNLFIADYVNNVIRKASIPGTLVLNSVGVGNAGAYDVVVSSPYGSVTSSVVNLTITIPGVFLSTPQINGGKTNFTFLLNGPAGSNYVLQVSTNLVNWSSVSTSTIPISGTITLTNAISSYKNGFYRAYLQ